MHPVNKFLSMKNISQLFLVCNSRMLLTPFVVSVSDHDINPSTRSGRTVCPSLYQRS